MPLLEQIGEVEAQIHLVGALSLLALAFLFGEPLRIELGEVRLRLGFEPRDLVLMGWRAVSVLAC